MFGLGCGAGMCDVSSGACFSSALVVSDFCWSLRTVSMRTSHFVSFRLSVVVEVGSIALESTDLVAWLFGAIAKRFHN